ncbi:MAG: 1-acyl-sn-glycerol-3-phosphate acyltransferase [Nitrospirae bacterium CG18_big_fil_WC_8_21_14_2_50_70_55]|nr:1-acyl-sn-glycerol-3-phosphate acyltransferase [Deltaproteobacteria bacterium]OIP63382.1 MAG: hypothetical protein AUK30_08570 [Nitrospirae bacterium CG2_30_70_394]PIQ05399.1 MAG: 1-acyl-sn-glycerol-3-phosphate acyltransferase [Nitrospirae bacterium CG18_big_fil_WC_8_21_14_2_50_70_55]PIU80038.1 MAG: 1-acyl-sn-glycerol-3-phosphate acyltransferase [Nitrospirae bacterium CG06_land_8_20_14_3_00_70_43]PIW83520.1 MAG: 1-acyl-sn-glycerol-3-phosphate acyltransferase [Nitrospirae bacterium CG_4_8_14_
MARRRPLVQGAWKIGGRLVMRAFLRLRVEGREHLPTRGGVILATNHVSNLDPPVVGCQIHRPHAAPAKQELFVHPIRGAILRQWGGIPIDRSHPSHQVMEELVAWLNHGDVLLIFPEGTRSTDGRLRRFQRGVALLSLAARVPVVPGYVHGTRQSMPPGSLLPRPARVTVAFGPPLWPDEFTNLRHPDQTPFSDHQTQAYFTARVRNEIRRLARGLGDEV